MKRSKENQWGYSQIKVFIGKYRAIRHKLTGELCLSGKHGEIWENIPNRLKVVLFNARRASRLLKPRSFRTGDEAVHDFPIVELDYWVKAIGLPKRSIAAQVRYASSRSNHSTNADTENR